MQSHQSREVGWAETHPKDTLWGMSQGVSVRALHRGKQGFAFSNDMSPKGVSVLWDQACTMASLMQADKNRVIPFARRPLNSRTNNLFSRVDTSLFKSSANTVLKRLSRFESALLARDHRVKKILRLSLRESLGSSAVLNSRGVQAQNFSSHASFGVELLGQDGPDVQSCWDSMSKRFGKDVEFSRILNDVCVRLLQSFGASAIPSGQWPVVLTSRVGVDFLELLSQAFCADAVQQGRSFLRGKKNTRAASPLVTLVDDGRYPGGLVSAAFDGEGCPTQTTVLLKKGILKEYLYDSYTAACDKRASTGNAVRSSWHELPGPGPSHFYMAPGQTSVQDMLKETPKAFVVQDVLGMHTADPISGDFSVGASGVVIEKGRIVQSVRGVTLAGNIMGLLTKVDAVADDMTWHGQFGSPTFRVSELSVGGK